MKRTSLFLFIFPFLSFNLFYFSFPSSSFYLFIYFFLSFVLFFFPSSFFFYLFIFLFFFLSFILFYYFSLFIYFILTSLLLMNIIMMKHLHKVMHKLNKRWQKHIVSGNDIDWMVAWCRGSIRDFGSRDPSSNLGVTTFLLKETQA